MSLHIFGGDAQYEVGKCYTFRTSLINYNSIAKALMIHCNGNDIGNTQCGSLLHGGHVIKYADFNDRPCLIQQ